MNNYKLARKIYLPLLFVVISSEAAFYPSAKIATPLPQREFRGVWIATVGNIDWPSKPGLPVEQQKAELIKILDNAVELKLNVVIFQVRTSCDALYKSSIEPWSEYLTGTMGQAPKPFYDPLAFAVEEAHKRGLELHAWFNPFRARYFAAKSPVSSNHISKTRPAMVRQYGKQLWLDPGMLSVQDYSRDVILDVVRRYDIDGVHIDDYFYPYVEKDSNGNDIPFPDENTYALYKAKGGKLSKEDWRRENINNFVKNLYSAIHREKNWVKFGISPFGIWRPDATLSIRGMDAYERLFADSKKWINLGWCDYFAPQLYWSIDAQGQSFPILLKWWSEQNSRRRVLVCGINTTRVGNQWQASEIINQINISRKNGAHGHIHWNASALVNNRGNISTELLKNIYRQPAISPQFEWIDSTPPKAPKVYISSTAARKSLILQIEPQGKEKPFLYLVQTKVKSEWLNQIHSGTKSTIIITNSDEKDAIAVSAIDRCGNLSQPTAFIRN
jgi:uncharacterized lipoprotein YddW (UPF0748 family)